MTPLDLRTARKRLGITQAEAAALLGCDRVTWARYEGGTRPMSDVLYRYWLHVAGLERIPWHPAKKCPIVATGGDG